MKFLSTVVLFFAMVTIATSSHAQEAPKNSGATGVHAAPQSKEDANKDFDSRMAKIQEAESKMESKESKAKSPEMKADMDALIAKMKQITDEYNAMKGTAGMSKEQQEESQKRIRSEMEEVRKMHDDMKAKYGDEMGEKGKKGNSQQQQQAQPAGSTPR